MGVLIVLNNYLHDLATGTWLTAGVFQWALLRRAPGTRRPAAVVGGNAPAATGRPAAAGRPEVLGALRTARWVARMALGWILVGGVVRAAAFRRYEWSDAAGRGQLPLLAAKHALLGGAVLAALRVERKARRAWQETV
ncbi:MAG: hypothetical protein Kow00122_20630 [Thermoleophilia bacterium]